MTIVHVHRTTPVQAGILFHEVTGHAGQAYLNHLEFDLVGTLRVHDLAAAFSAAVQRHEVLRTSYHWQEADEPVAAVHDAADPRVTVHPRTGPTAVTSLLADIAARPLDPAEPGLTRVDIVPVDDETTRVLWTHHHLVLDGWSLAVVFGEIMADYRRRGCGVPPDVTVPTTPFRAYLDGLDVDDAADAGYWTSELDGVTPSRLRLPPVAAGAEGFGRLDLPMGADRAERLRRLAAAHEATLAAVLELAWGVTLERCCDSDAVVFGTVVSGRQHVEGPLGSVVGMLVTTVPVTVRVAPGDTVAAQLRRRMETRADRERHAHAPLTRIARWAGHGDGELFDTLLAIENFPVEHVELPDGLTLRTVRVSEHTHYPVTVTYLDGATPRLEVDYRRDRVDPTAAAGITAYLDAVLDALASGVSRLDDIAPPTAPKTPATIPPEHGSTPCTVLDHVLATVAATPDATAVVEGTVTHSYAALHTAARLVAGHLRAHGLGEGAVVAVSCAGGMHLAAAILAVMGCGATYLAQDPHAPAPRLGDERTRTGAALVLDDAEVDRALSAGTTAELRAHPGHPAYLVLTSGSTGQPKVVAVGHEALGAHAVAATHELHLRPGDRVLQFTTPAFDVMAEELFPTWLAGAALVCGPRRFDSPADFVALVDARRVTVVNIPAAWWHLWVDELDHAPVPGCLRLVVVGDEPVWGSHLTPWSAHTGGRVDLVNAYGTSETTVTTTTFHVPSDCRWTGPTVPVGHPLPGMRISLVDRRGRAACPGLVGEVAIGGSGVALGYHGRPAETARRFVPDPDATGRRRYLTGDRGYRLPDGALVLAGRVDDQVQVRGHRVEPAEVERALAADPAVAEAVVTTTQETGSSAVLTAHVVLRHDAEHGPRATAEEIRQRLLERVPAHLVPARVLVRDRMPLTGSGKVDRQALAAADPPSEPRPDLPATGTEQWVVDTWRDVLGPVDVRRDSSFFALGGDSLSATRVTGRIRRAFGTSTTITDVMSAVTPVELARLVDRHLRDLVPASLEPPLIAGPPESHTVLTFTQERLWFLDRLARVPGAYNLTSAWELDGEVDPSTLRTALAAVVARHDALRSAFPEVDGRPVLRVRTRLPVDLAVEPLPTDAVGLRATLADEAAAPVDLESGPLFRFRLLRGPARRHVLVVTVHHIVFDGWSHTLFLRDLSTAYTAAEAGERPDLPTPPIQAADLARWQRDRLDGGSLEALLEEWERVLEGAPTRLALPLDRSRPPGPRRPGRARFTVDPETTDRLRALARDLDCTLYVLLLGAFAATLHGYCSSEDLLVGTPVAGRVRPETEEVVGCLVNTLPLRSRLRPGTRFADYVDDLRAMCYMAIQHQEVPFEQLVQRLTTDRDLDLDPLVQVMFLFQNTPRGELRLGTARARGLELREPAKLDLMLTMSDESGSLEGLWEYDAGVLDAATLDRLTDTLRAVWESVCDDPDVIVEHIRPGGGSIATTPLEAGPAELVADGLARQAAATPGRTAIRSPEGELDYTELATRADATGRAVRATGVGRGDTVAVVDDPDLTLLPAIWGVWRAGAAYLPLDPDLPTARLRRLVELTGTRVVLAPERHRHLAALLGLELVPCDVLPATHSGEDHEPGPVPVDAEAPPLGAGDAAYVLFTSGSTGEPKGVTVSHGALAAFTAALVDRQGVSADDVGILHHRLSFDASVMEYAPVLVRGGAVVLGSRSARTDPREILDDIDRHGATLLYLTASQASVLLADERFGRCTSLRMVTNCGEALPAGVATAITSRLRVELENHYGPTEATVGVTAARIAREESAAGESPPIGRPLPGSTIQVIDPAGRPVVLGAIGELAVAGAQLAQGYHARAALTAERFRPDPYAVQPGGRRYLTGDLGRIGPDGLVEHHGRNDRQVKVRGHRVEPAEVESALLALPGVVAAAVGARDGQLVAFVTPADLPEGPLRDRLRDCLPHALVPDRISAVDRISMSANGKADLAALMAGLTDDPTAWVPPAPGTEAEVAGLMAALLGIPRLSATESFFRAGGHSLLALQLVTRLNAAFGIELPLRTVFSHPTPRDLTGPVEDAVVAAVDETALLEALDAVEAVEVSTGAPHHHDTDRQETT